MANENFGVDFDHLRDEFDHNTFGGLNKKIVTFVMCSRRPGPSANVKRSGCRNLLSVASRRVIGTRYAQVLLSCGSEGVLRFS